MTKVYKKYYILTKKPCSDCGASLLKNYIENSYNSGEPIMAVAALSGTTKLAKTLSFKYFEV